MKKKAPILCGRKTIDKSLFLWYFPSLLGSRDCLAFQEQPLTPGDKEWRRVNAESSKAWQREDWRENPRRGCAPQAGRYRPAQKPPSHDAEAPDHPDSGNGCRLRRWYLRPYPQIDRLGQGRLVLPENNAKKNRRWRPERGVSPAPDQSRRSNVWPNVIVDLWFCMASESMQIRGMLVLSIVQNQQKEKNITDVVFFSFAM